MKTFGQRLKTSKNWYYLYQSLKVDRSVKIKTNVYDHIIYNNFCGLNVPEDNIECQTFTDISIDS